MIRLFAKLWIKDCENVKDARVRKQYGMLCSIVGIGLNVLLFLGKYLTGLLSHSIAIMADSFNNLSDAGSSFITMIGFQAAGKAADKEHPFGHGRIEYISGMAVAVLIILMGAELAKSSIKKIVHPEDVESSLLTLVVLLVSIAVKLYMAYYNRTVGDKISSAAMRATAADSMSDSVATSVVLVSILFNRITGINVDGVAGLLVAAFILYTGYGAVKDTMGPLLGQAPDPEFVKEVRDIVMSYEGIVGIHDMIVHDYGPGRVMVSLHAEVPGNGDIFDLHDTVDHAEMELRRKLGCDATIHMDPIDVDDEKVQRYQREVAGKIRELDERITIHDFRMVDGRTHTNLIFDAVVPPQFKMTNDEVKKWIEEMVRKEFPKCFAVVRIDRFFIS